MSNNNKTPAIRFKGFTDTWEQREVGETYNVTRGYVLAAPKTSPIKTDEMPYPVYSSQTKDEGLMGYYNEYLYENAITWTTDGANAGTVNYRAGKFYCTNVCGLLLSDKGYANKAAAEALNMIAWKWVSHVGNPKLMNNVMAGIEISLPPTLQEQDKISEFLESLDTFITLHQRKCDKLIQFKAAMLQKMFPQNGADKPEIRFKGFTDAWEQRKCSDFIKLVGGATPSKANKDYWDGDIVWLSSQEIKGGFVSKGTYNITQKAVDDNTTKMIPANTPMFISRSGILANSFPITRALCDVAINQDIKALLFDHTVFSNDYIVHYLESKEQFILKSIVKSGTTVQSVSIPDFEKMPINIPASKDEQDRIGIYFENLDTLITLHQRKCDKYKSIKAGLIRRLFP